MPGEVTQSSVIRDILTRYPKAEAIFNKHGLTGCGGPRGPIEPVGFFAVVHHVNPDDLIAELNEFIANYPEEEAPTAPQEEAPPEVYKLFLKTALIVALSAGWTLGAIALAAISFGWPLGMAWAGIIKAHGHAQLFGWVSLFIMGVAYHVLPRLKATQLASYPLAIASFWLVLGGLVLRVVAQLTVAGDTLAGLVTLSAAAELVGVSVFAYVALRTLASSPQPTDYYEKYLVAGIGWFWLFAATNLGLGIYSFNLPEGDTAAIPFAVNNAFLQIGLMGFIGMTIFGITLRTIPVFMGLRPPNKGAFTPLFWLLNLGTALSAAGFAGDALAPLARVGVAVVFIGVVAFIYLLNLFRAPETDVAEAGDRSYEKFIYAAYAWLAVAVTMSLAYAVYETAAGQPVPGAFTGAYLHALTVGFISMMIMGMASRIIPVFAGTTLHSPQLSLAAFFFMNVGNLLRVASEPAANVWGGPFYPLLGVSGWLEVLALTLFAYNIWKTMDKSPEDEPAGKTEAITGSTIVADVLNRYPASLGIFISYGLTPLLNPVTRHTLAKAVTVEQAARVHGKDVAKLLADLNVAARAGQEDKAAITKDSRVGKVIEKYPEALDVFLRYGFEQLKDETLRKTVASSVTIELAAHMHSIDLEKLLAELNEVCLGRVSLVVKEDKEETRKNGRQ